MSIHIIDRDLMIAYNPSEDTRWRPECMRSGVWYPVFGYENGTIRRADGSVGEAFYFHFVGDGGRPGRLLAANGVLLPGNTSRDPDSLRQAYERIVALHRPVGGLEDDPRR